jgi:hypothetical protein
MKTNDTFDFRRFGKYFRSDISTCWANYGLSLLTISILSPVFFYILSTAFNLIFKSTWDGPDIGARFLVFCIGMLCMVATMPVKCYGKLTEKQYGSFWLMLPASRLEKFISMFILTCLIAPLLGMALYLGADALLCSLDHTCGRSMIAGGIDLIRNIGNITEVTLNLAEEKLTIENAAAAQKIISQLSSPMLYIDEIFGITLPFLLGAVFFKSGKTVKTFLTLFAVSTATSIIMSPFLSSWTVELVNNAGHDPDIVFKMLSEGVFQHLVLIDTVSDTIFNVALLAGIWFRIKTLKH